MLPEILPFDFDGENIRVATDDDGNPWWFLVDVCKILGIKNPSQAVTRLKSNEVSTLCFSEGGQPRSFNIVNEKGLYRLMMRSNKPEAERFQEWIYGDVIPSIRKTGKYEPSLSAVSDPTLQAILHQSKQIEALVISIDQARKLAIAAEERAVSAERAAM